MTVSELSETGRVQQQSVDEWRAELEGDKIKIVTASVSSQPAEQQPEIESNALALFCQQLKNASIVSVRLVGNKLLITTDRPMTTELDNRIKQCIHDLAEIAEPDTGESLYEYTGYRTLVSKGAYLAVTFREIHAGTLAERYFNVELKNKKGKYFKTGENREFRIVGNTKRLQEGMFLKFWLDAVKQVPNDRPSQIWRYMNSKLSNVVASCSDSVPHHGITKLKKLKYEGHIYQIT